MPPSWRVLPPEPPPVAKKIEVAPHTRALSKYQDVRGTARKRGHGHRLEHIRANLHSLVVQLPAMIHRALRGACFILPFCLYSFALHTLHTIRCHGEYHGQCDCVARDSTGLSLRTDLDFVQRSPAIHFLRHEGKVLMDKVHTLACAVARKTAITKRKTFSRNQPKGESDQLHQRTCVRSRRNVNFFRRSCGFSRRKARI